MIASASKLGHLQTGSGLSLCSKAGIYDQTKRPAKPSTLSKCKCELPGTYWIVSSHGWIYQNRHHGLPRSAAGGSGTVGGKTAVELEIGVSSIAEDRSRKLARRLS